MRNLKRLQKAAFTLVLPFAILMHSCGQLGFGDEEEVFESQLDSLKFALDSMPIDGKLSWLEQKVSSDSANSKLKLFYPFYFVELYLKTPFDTNFSKDNQSFKLAKWSNGFVTKKDTSIQYLENEKYKYELAARESAFDRMVELREAIDKKSDLNPNDLAK
jgi:hypothetical protein